MAFDKTKLNQSSFRDIPFFTRDDDVSGGQRLTDHKFINGGTKTESNGIENDTFTISGYIGGDDYLDNKAALREAFKNTDSGILIDKFYGELEVYVEKWSIKESIGKIGNADIEVTFKLSENQVVEDTDIVFTANARTEAISNFKNKFNNKIGEELLEKTSNSLTDFLNKIQEPIKFVRDKLNKIEAIKNKIGVMKSQIKETILDTESLATDISNVGDLFDDMLNVDMFTPYEQKSFTNSLRSTIEAENSKTSSNIAEELANAQSKIYVFTMIAVLTQTAISNLENVEFDTGDDLGSVKDDILTIYEILEQDIISNAGTTIDDIIISQELLYAYQTVRREFIEFYTQKYSGLQNLESSEIVATTNAYNLTMDLYLDINRVNEVLVNNDIVDPLFISGNILILRR